MIRVSSTILRASASRRNRFLSATMTPTRFVLLICVVLAVVFFTPPAKANRVGTCLRNCAQCTKMFGRWFDGLLCADTCVKYKGKMIPDCEDAESIEPYLMRVED